MEYLQLRYERVEQAIESLGRLWEDHWFRKTFIQEELENPYAGVRFVRITDGLAEMIEEEEAGPPSD